MAKHFVYFYFMKPLPDAIREMLPRHVEYWKTRHLAGYSGGPFADRSGGLITFDASTLDEARALADADPFATHDLLDASWVKEWLAE